MIDFWGRMTIADRRRAQSILRQIECSSLAARPWTYLSQGERQRVLIGRALGPRPRLLILDEPCAGLDPVAREHFLQFLQRLARSRRGPALVLVTHHIEEILPGFTDVLVLRRGKVLAAGPRGRVLNSRVLSEAFESGVSLRRSRVGYVLRVRAARRAVL
jgi:iron complex transport system ATP-binding protein